MPEVKQTNSGKLGAHQCYVRVRTSDGKWVGGYVYREYGFVTTYPEPARVATASFLSLRRRRDTVTLSIDNPEARKVAFCPTCTLEKPIDQNAELRRPIRERALLSWMSQ